jgi:hypothetical protein
MDLPGEPTLRWLVRRYASLLARDGHTGPKRRLVLPTAEFFPDPFDGDPGSLNLLFWRLQEHAHLTDLEIELRPVDDGGEDAAGCGCGTGGCKTDGGGHGAGHGGGGDCACGADAGKHSLAPVESLKDGAYRVYVRRSDARNATSLTAAMATSLAHAFVIESGGFDAWPESECMASCELAAVTLGFGPLLLGASHQYAKGCHGVKVDRTTALEVAEIALAVALYVALGEHASGRLSSNLEPTQREAYREAKMWVDSNPRLVKKLSRDPGAVAADEQLAFEPARPWLARVLGIGRKRKAASAGELDDAELAELAASIAARRKAAGAGEAASKDDARMKELRALVDESLSDVRAARND